MYDVEKRANDLAVMYCAAGCASVAREKIAAALRDALEAAAEVADRYAKEAAERGRMIGGAPMHGREVADRQLGELVASNIASDVRALK